MSTEISTDSESTVVLAKNKIWGFRDEVIQLGFDLPEVALIEALPASGKSYGSMKWAANTENPVTLLAPRHKLLDKEYEPWCEEFRLTSKRLPSFYRDCTSLKESDSGEYKPIDQSAEEFHKEYKQGISAEEVHFRYPNIPCQEDSKCPFMERRSFDPGEYDVLLGTYRHAHVKEWIKDRYIIFDEFPGEEFQMTFDGEAESVISAYLQDNDDLPFDSYRGLQFNRNAQSVGESVEEWKGDLHSSLSDKSHPRRSGSSSAHTLAPLTTLALVEAEPLENNWLYADLGNGKKAVSDPEDNNWTFLLPPKLEKAKSVIGLDGTPNEELWSQALNEDVQSLPLLNREGKRKYLQSILGLKLIQTTEAWKAVQSGDGVAPPKDLALIEGIARKTGQSPALISSKKGVQQYREEGLDKITENTEHYNNLKGMNAFENERLGIVLGNPHPGDGKILKWCAFAGVAAEVKKDKDGEELRGPETDYGSYGNRVMGTFIHDEVLQAVMRFGRKETNDEKGATVYIHTCAVPPWLPVETQIAEIDAWLTEKNGMIETIEAIQSLDGWRHKEWPATALYGNVSISNRQVRNRLDDLAEEDYIHFEGCSGQGGSKHYTNICLEDAGRFGHVEFHG
jgi:hypothetical protein